MVHSSSDAPSILITHADGTERRVSGARLDRATSQQIFDRRGRVAQLDVFVSA